MNTKESFEVEINNEVLKWVINTSGWDTSKLAEKVGISEDYFNKVLNNEKKLTITQLTKLSKLIKRPLAFFLLSELPPEEKKPLPKDYRMISEKEGVFSKETLLTIRIARRLQAVSRELAQNLNTDLEPTVTTVTIEDNPQKIAEEYRNKVKISEGLQKKWDNPNKLLNFLREFIERQNILVFQFPMPVEDVRGFTLSDSILKVIVVNSKDQITARIFTLMHEFAHILLNESVINMPEESLFVDKNQNEIERWCNNFTSEFLLPDSLARKIFEENKPNLTETKTLNQLSNKWKISKKFILYKMFKLRYINKQQLEEILKRPYKEKKAKGGPSPDVKCVSEKGKKFVSLVSANVNNNFITFVDALEYLSIKSHHYQKVLQKIRGE
jgi:Zn-dependent peptidase ImmA (M78 family)